MRSLQSYTHIAWFVAIAIFLMLDARLLVQLNTITQCWLFSVQSHRNVTLTGRFVGDARYDFRFLIGCQCCFRSYECRIIIQKWQLKQFNFDNEMSSIFDTSIQQKGKNTWCNDFDFIFSRIKPMDLSKWLVSFYVHVYGYRLIEKWQVIAEIIIHE